MNVLQFILQNHAEVLELTAEHLWLVGAPLPWRCSSEFRSAS